MIYKGLILKIFPIAGISLLLFIAPAFSQTRDEAISSTLRRLEEETREELSRTEEIEKALKEKKVVWEYGGWISHYFWRFEDKDDRKDTTDVRNTNYTDLRLWLKATILEKHLFYARIKDVYIAKNDTSSAYTGIGDDHNGPHLDLGYFNLALFNPYRLIVGRQYLTLGKGIAYNRIHDGVQITADYPLIRLKVFAAKTKPHEDHLDYSIPSYDKGGWQFFSGFELAWVKNRKFIPYTYFLYEKDHPKEEPEDTTQDYNYDARFLGLGLAAKPTNNLSWWLEVIKENGESYTDSFVVSPEKKDVDAWASVVGGKYAFPCLTHPVIDLEYAWGSGDKDRLSTTNTAGGGNLYADDTGFQYFGYYFAGYRLDPRLSNIHIYRLGISALPFEKFKFGKKILAGIKFFVYRKDKKGAGIYDDTPAVGISRDIGKEVNAYLYWLPTPKLTLAFRYGVFFPGGAYSDNTDEATQYLNTYVTLNF